MFIFALVDADECGLEQACCAHHCSNNPGGYTCSCRSGFALNRNDGCSCDGECFLCSKGKVALGQKQEQLCDTESV